jgi:hypothetical protein
MHFSVIVVVRPGETVEGNLAPFDENLKVPEYLVNVVSENDKQEFINYYNRKGDPRQDFEAMYKSHGKAWNYNQWKVDPEDGQWKEYSTYNPYSQWDWYELGGRWNGKFIVEGEKSNAAEISEIKNLKDLTAYAVLVDGKYFTLEAGETVFDFVKDLPKDVELYNMDLHI